MARPYKELDDHQHFAVKIKQGKTVKQVRIDIELDLVGDIVDRAFVHDPEDSNRVTLYCHGMPMHEDAKLSKYGLKPGSVLEAYTESDFAQDLNYAPPRIFKV
jgi:hypothetical protein